jgi:predicted Zn-ribbon and HTH transcriptional regulator
MRYNKETPVKCPKCGNAWTSQLKLDGTPGVAKIPSTIDYQTLVCGHCGHIGELDEFKSPTKEVKNFVCKNCGYTRQTASKSHHKLCPRCDQDNWEDVSEVNL